MAELRLFEPRDAHLRPHACAEWPATPAADPQYGLSRDPARPHQKIGRNLPRLADLVNHLDRQRTAPVQQLGCTRPRAEQLGEFGFWTSEIFVGGGQQGEWIGGEYIMPL